MGGAAGRRGRRRPRAIGCDVRECVRGTRRQLCVVARRGVASRPSARGSRSMRRSGLVTARSFAVARSQYRWALLAILAIVGLVLGYVGLDEYYADRGVDASFADLVYADLKLLGMGGSPDLSNLPWELDVARFLLPFVFVYGAFLGVLALFRERVAQARLPFIREHSVIIGLGEKGAAFHARAAGGWSPGRCGGDRRDEPEHHECPRPRRRGRGRRCPRSGGARNGGHPALSVPDPRRAGRGERRRRPRGPRRARRITAARRVPDARVGCRPVRPVAPS